MAPSSSIEPSDNETGLSSELADAVLLLDREPEGLSNPGDASAELVASGRNAGMIGGLAAAAVVLLFVLFGQGQDGAGSGNGSPEPQSVEESGVVQAPAAIAAWPDPPIDHDPHVSGRPGSQEPVRETLVGQTIVYVNDLGRPTIIDLSTGDQREVDVAGPRSRDEFFVEFGKVVSLGKTTVDLPESQGQAFAFSVHRTAQLGDQAGDDSDLFPAMAGPSLCLDEGRCPTVPFTFGTFGAEANQATAIESALNPTATIAEVLGADWWSREGRWTTFAIDEPTAENRRAESPGESELRIPTPMDTAVVWVVVQSPS